MTDRFSEANVPGGTPAPGGKPKTERGQLPETTGVRSSKERSLLDESRKVLRAIREDFFKTGDISGRSQRAGEDLLARIDSYFQSPVETNENLDILRVALEQIAVEGWDASACVVAAESALIESGIWRERRASGKTTPLQRILDVLTSEETMKRWDRWRAMIAAGDRSSGPRDDFESWLDSVADIARQALPEKTDACTCRDQSRWVIAPDCPVHAEKASGDAWYQASECTQCGPREIAEGRCKCTRQKYNR